jgi:hypothetical protein
MVCWAMLSYGQENLTDAQVSALRKIVEVVRMNDEQFNALLESVQQADDIIQGKPFGNSR